MTVRYFKTATELNFYFCWAVYITTLIYGVEKDINGLSCLLILVGALLLNLPDILSLRTGFFRVLLQISGLLLPFLSLIKGFDVGTLLLFVLPFGYYAFSYYSGRQDTNREEFIHRFKVMGWGLIPIPLLVFSIDNTLRVKALQTLYPFVLLFIVCGILDLQNLRWSGRTHGKGIDDKRQFGELALFCGLAAFISLTDYISRLNTWLINHVIYPAVEAIYGGSIVGLYRIIMFIRDHMRESNRDREREYVEFIESVEHSTDIMPETPPPAAAEATEVVHDNTQFILLGILILIFILVVFLLKSKKSRPVVAGEELREQIVPQKKERPKRRKKSSDTVRSLYAEYMKKIASKKKLDQSDTTGEIESAALSCGMTDAESAHTITEVYREARYNDDTSKEKIKKLRKILSLL